MVWWRHHCSLAQAGDRAIRSRTIRSGQFGADNSEKTGTNISSNKTKMDNSTGFQDFLTNLLLTSREYAILHCGSAFELPLQYVITNATDVDVMYISTNTCAVPENMSALQKFQVSTFTINTRDTYPGFARLYSSDCKRLHHRQDDLFGSHYKRGPAWTEEFGNHRHGKIINFLSEAIGLFRSRDTIISRLSDMFMDRVPAIHCPSWPPEADEWKTRERPNGWPSVEVIDKIVASGCYFVAKPHHSSPDDDTQWRFSFSQAELILIHSWTDVQKYIYHILRLIKNEVVKSCGGPEETVLCNYFIKTLMLWECERKPKEFWIDHNVAQSISELLCTMIEWLIDRCCSNYFIPQYNMMNDSTEGVDFTKEILLLQGYTLSDITKITTLWPRAYPKNEVGHLDFDMSEKVFLSLNLFQLRDNYVNPFYPNHKSHLSKQLTERSVLLRRKANDLYKGILSHLQLMKTRCEVSRCNLRQIALDHFMSSLTESADGCSRRCVSVGESIYELFERVSSSTDCEFKPGHEPSTDIHVGLGLSLVGGNARQSPLDAHAVEVEHSSDTHGRFAVCYSRLVENEQDTIENRRTIMPTCENINASVKTMLQYGIAMATKRASITTRIISLAYLANFYYTALQDYETTSSVCDSFRAPSGKSILVLPDETLTPSESEMYFPVFLTNQLSFIFDEHFQVVLGFVTLIGSVVAPSPDSSAVLVRLCPAQFTKYLKIRCRRWEGEDVPATDEHFKCGHSFQDERDEFEQASQVIMSAVLHASRKRT